MKKKLYYFFTIISLCCLITTIFFRSTYYSFNSSNVKNNIEYLSSSKMEGRLTGSNTNEVVAKEIKKTFIEYGLKPVNKDYLEGFNVKAPIFTGDKCTINVMDGTKVVKELEVGNDFKEDLLNFKSSFVKLSKNDKITIYPKAILIEQDNKKYIFYVTFDKDFSFRSSFIYESPFEFAIQINTSTFNEILNSIRKGYVIDIKLPYNIEDKEVFNVVGKLEGSNNTLSPLIITAHFDHVGIDSLGNMYYGALDNASGTSFLLELARTFSSLKRPKRDIIFVALNAEEFGLLGSKNFAEKYASKYPGATVINFDMIGATDCPITFMDGKNNINKISSLLKNLESICIDKDIKFLTSNQDSSDHASFINNGFTAITFCHSDVSNIHTPRDTSEKISTESIDDVYNIASTFIKEYSYPSYINILYSKFTLFIFTLSSGALISIYFIRIRKSNSN